MARFRLALLTALTLFATTAFAKDVYLSVGGSVGAFRTDARIFNPSQTKDIQISAYYLPVGNGDNSAVQPVTITVAKRSQVMYDDVVASLFHAGGLGAIRLSSADDFIATQRIYATATNTSSATPCVPSVNPCTLGQFLTGVDSTSAKKNGVLIQIKSNASYRTNVGLVNPNAAAASVTWRIYDKNNAVVATFDSTHAGALPTTVQPFGVVGPTNASISGADLSDAWIGYTSDQPLVVYASVVDNGSTDQTYIPALEDSSPPAITTPSALTFDVTLRTASITITPAITAQTLKIGDVVTFRVTNVQTDATHGFTLVAPSGKIMVPDRFYPPGSGTVLQTFTVPSQGTFAYFCTNSACSSGHTNMTGSFDVGQPSETDPGGKY